MKTDRSGDVVSLSENSIRNKEGCGDQTDQTASKMNGKGIHRIINFLQQLRKEIEIDTPNSSMLELCNLWTEN